MDKQDQKFDLRFPIETRHLFSKIRISEHKLIIDTKINILC